MHGALLAGQDVPAGKGSHLHAAHLLLEDEFGVGCWAVLPWPSQEPLHPLLCWGLPGAVHVHVHVHVHALLCWGLPGAVHVQLRVHQGRRSLPEASREGLSKLRALIPTCLMPGMQLGRTQNAIEELETALKCDVDDLNGYLQVGRAVFVRVRVRVRVRACMHVYVCVLGTECARA